VTTRVEPGYDDRTTEAAMWIRRGDDARGHGRTEEARLSYVQALRRRPDLARGWARLAGTLVELGAHADAAPALAEAERLSPQDADILTAVAGTLRRLGQLERSRARLVAALALQPESAVRLSNLAALDIAGGRAEEAHNHVRRGVLVDPTRGAHVDTLGRLLAARGDDAGARRAWRVAISLDPLAFGPMSDLATSAARAGRFEEAARRFDRVLVLDPNNESARAGSAHAQTASRFTAAVEIGGRLDAVGRHAEAARAYRLAEVIEPTNPLLLSNAASAEADAGAFERAIVLTRRAVLVDATVSIAWNNLAQALMTMGAMESAEAAWRRAVCLSPIFVGPLCGLAALLGNAEDAARLLARAVRAEPEGAVARGVQAAAALRRHDLVEAEEACRRGLALDPALPSLLNNRGRVDDLTRIDDRVTWFDRAIQVGDPPTARLNRGMTLLRAGRVAEGWDGYAARFASGEARPRRRFAVPEWDGSPLKGRRLLIWREQGLGDEILFASVYPDVIREAGEVVIECDPRLLPLFQRSFPKARVRPERPGAKEGAARGIVENVDCDLHVPAGSLPALFRRRVSEFPRDRDAWLRPNTARAAEWTEILDDLGPGARVGIAWRSGLMTAERRAAYLPLERWGALFRVPNVHLVNLQYDAREEEMVEAERLFGRRIHRWPGTDLKNDLDGAAALTAGMDLVVTPANSVGEIAGALGIPTWRIGWRDWTQLGSGTRPWYPSMRLFQPTGDAGALDEALARVVRELTRATASIGRGEDRARRKTTPCELMM